MFGMKSHRSRPLFLWITVVATTALLALVIWVMMNNSSASPSATPVGAEEEKEIIVPTVSEKEYAQDMRTRVETYVTQVEGFDVIEDKDEWLEAAQDLHNALLATPVPPRMQTLHLDAVLQVSQAVSALESENTTFLADHLGQLTTITSALSYE